MAPAASDRCPGGVLERLANGSICKQHAGSATCGSYSDPQTVPSTTDVQAGRLAGPRTTRKRLHLPAACSSSDLRVRRRPANRSVCRQRAARATCGYYGYPQTAPSASGVQLQRLAGTSVTRKRFHRPSARSSDDLRVRRRPANRFAYHRRAAPATCGSQHDPQTAPPASSGQLGRLAGPRTTHSCWFQVTM